MKSKISVFFLLLITIFSFTLYAYNPYKKVKAETSDFTSKAYILIEKDTGDVILENNSIEKYPIASMCKIMTLLIAFEKENVGELDFDKSIKISKNASSMGGSQVFLEENGEYKVEKLIESIVVCSANDSCVAIAEEIAGSESNFVEMMNNKCIELSMNNTVFTNCTGLPKPGQFSCAKDVSIMFKELIGYSKYLSFANIWMDKFDHPEGRYTEISNTNKLIKQYKHCKAGKTGYTSEAGHCLASYSTYNNMDVVSVIINSQSSKDRFNQACKMFDYAFDNYTVKNVIDCNQKINEKASVRGGVKDYVDIIPSESIKILCKKGENRNFEVVNQINNLCAPVQKNQIVGKISVYEKGQEIGTVNLISVQNVSKKSYFNCLDQVINDWV